MLNLLHYDPFLNDVDHFERFSEHARFYSCAGCPSNGKDIEEDAERLDYLTRFVIPDSRVEAARFLRKLDPVASSFTFQTFDDNAKRKDGKLVRILHGTLDQHWNTLCNLNRKGAGIYITVNATDGKGRSATNITRARALFVDLDGAPLEPVIKTKEQGIPFMITNEMKARLREHGYTDEQIRNMRPSDAGQRLSGMPSPHIIVESSPGKYHCYWLVEDVAREQFTGLQTALAARFGGDPKVIDLPRVLRLPGFWHRKDEPYKSHIISLRHSVPAYRVADFDLSEQQDHFADHAKKVRKANYDPDSPTSKLNTRALANLAAWVPEIFPNAKPYAKSTDHGAGYRVSSADLGRDLEEDISIVPEGIVDHGVADQGDPREGKRTPVELTMEHWIGVPIEDIVAHTNHDAFVESCDWLRERIGDEDEQETEAPNAEQTTPNDRPWPVLAPEALHGLAGEVVRTVEPHTEADNAAILVQFLVSFGNMIGRGPFVQREGDKHFTVLNTVLVGESAKSRKGTSAGRIREIMNRVDEEWTARCIQSGLSSGEGLIWAIRDQVLSVNKKGETVVEVAEVKDKRLYLNESEFSQVLTVMRREGNTVSRVIRDAFDGHPLSSLTKNAKGSVRKPHISIVGHITRDELCRFLDLVSMTNGFANRFLYVCVRRSKELPHGGYLSAAAIDTLSKKISKVVTPLAMLAVSEGRVGVQDKEDTDNFEAFSKRQSNGMIEVGMNAKACTLWEGVYHDLTNGPLGVLGAICGRAETQVVRLALLYTLLDGKDEIEPVHLRAALAVWKYCEDSARYIFSDSVGSALADELLRVLREKGGMSRTDIQTTFQRNQKLENITAALKLLRERGLAMSEKQAPSSKGKGAGGRPVEFWVPKGVIS